MFQKFKEWVKQIKQEHQAKNLASDLKYFENSIKRATKNMFYALDVAACQKLKECISHRNFKVFKKTTVENFPKIQGQLSKNIAGTKKEIIFKNATPLHVAAATGCTFCIKPLLDLGFSIETQDDFGKKAMDYLIFKEGMDFEEVEYYSQLLQGRIPEQKKKKHFK